MGRGPHEADARLFAPNVVNDLRCACAELSWLLDRGYAEASFVALVGDRHRLRNQRIAITRSACRTEERTRRGAHRRGLQDLRGESLAIDGFNCVITVEAALASRSIVHWCIDLDVELP